MKSTGFAACLVIVIASFAWVPATPAHAQTVGCQPLPPRDVTAERSEFPPGQFVRWSAPHLAEVTGVDGYGIWRAVHEPGAVVLPGMYQPLAQVGPNTFDFFDPQAFPPGTVDYAVSAFNGCGESLQMPAMWTPYPRCDVVEPSISGFPPQPDVKVWEECVWPPPGLF